MTDVFTQNQIDSFDLVLDLRDASVYTNPGQKIIICKLNQDYIPIEEFKKIFNQISEIVKGGDYEKFIFDKRSLRAFHQPTMEWYFIHWKKEMLEHGVKTHRKILPAERWFEKMVQIAKDQILQNYPNNIIDQLDIQYCQSIEEAISK